MSRQKGSFGFSRLLMRMGPKRMKLANKYQVTTFTVIPLFKDEGAEKAYLARQLKRLTKKVERRKSERTP